MALRLAARQARLVVFGYNAVTSRIEWVRSPASPQYAGSPLSLSGGQVMAYYKDGTASDITASCGYDPDEGSLLEYAGELNINATYTDHAGNEFTADTQIDVADVEELFFTRLSNPTQKEGTALDLSGAVLSVRYTDGTTRNIDAGSVTFEPSAGEMIGHMETLSVQATWRNPATGSDYSAQYTINVDQADGIYFSHAPNKKDYAEGEPLDISGAVITLKYKRSGDIVIVTDRCTFYPPNGEIMTPYGASLHAYYQMPGGNQYEAETLLNVQAMTVPIDVIGQIVGEELGLDFNADLPSDFWDSFYPQNVPYYLSESDISNYLSEGLAFCDRGFDALVVDFMEEVIDRKTGRSLFFPHKKDSTFVHGKIYRRQFLLDNGIVWHPDVKCHEDSGYNCLALKVAKDVKYCQMPLYLWKWREGSICRKDPLYVPKTYTRMIYSNGWLVKDFLDRGMVEEAKYYTALLVYGTYYMLNKPIWLDPMNAQYRYETEKCFKDYYEKHRVLFQSVDPKVRKHIIAGTKRRVLKEGVLLEKFTFDEWIRHIEGME